jgi:hypothetical protein
MKQPLHQVSLVNRLSCYNSVHIYTVPKKLAYFWEYKGANSLEGKPQSNSRKWGMASLDYGEILFQGTSPS